MVKSSTKSSKSSKKIKGPFEKYNLFENIDLGNHCWKEDGKLVGGPGMICWLYIYFIIFINILSLLNINEYKKIGLNNTQIFIRYFFQFLYMFLSVTFMYSMCKRCRGLEGFFILVLLGIIASIIVLAPIINNLVNDMNKKTIEGNGDSSTSSTTSTPSSSKEALTTSTSSKEALTTSTTSTTSTSSPSKEASTTSTTNTPSPSIEELNP